MKTILFHFEIILALQYCYGTEDSIALIKAFQGPKPQHGNQIKWTTNIKAAETETSDEDSDSERDSDSEE